jgi:hypothetical protein
MSLNVQDPTSVRKTELETVTNWPALLAAAAAGALLLGVPLLLAGVSALRTPPPASQPVVERPTPAPAAPVVAQPLDLPEWQPTAPKLPPPPPGRVQVVYLPGKTSVAAVAPEKPAPEPRPFLRRDRRTVDELLRSLESASREIRLDEKEGTSERLVKQAKADDKATPVLDEIARRPDLAGLPARQASACKADPKRARLMAEISQYLAPVVAEISSPPHSGSFRPRSRLYECISDESGFVNDDGIPTLHQMLQVAEEDIRFRWVEALAAVKSPVATGALSDRALFDVSPHVREAAVRSLQGRPPSEVRALLLTGFRHPWAPAADHAAEALVALKDQKAVPDLVALVDQPDPCTPVRKGTNQWVVAELVRVNHLHNCLLCHAPSFHEEDLVRGQVPTPGRPVPRKYCPQPGDTVIRADVTYLRQDFSVMQRVTNPQRWPSWQRFDYLVRQRPLTAAEAARWTVAKTTEYEAQRGSYPQREAVLFALRDLTGMDAGKSSLGWRLALWMKSISTGS